VSLYIAFALSVNRIVSMLTVFDVFRPRARMAVSVCWVLIVMIQRGGSQGSIAPKGVAVCLAVMSSFGLTYPKHNMFVDFGFGDGRMLVYARAKFHYLRGTEIGGELPVLSQRTELWMR
jgi:hypothetical protein